MSRQNKVNPGMYTQRGRLTQDDAARELRKQGAIGFAHTWQPVNITTRPRPAETRAASQVTRNTTAPNAAASNAKAKVARAKRARIRKSKTATGKAKTGKAKTGKAKITAMKRPATKPTRTTLLARNVVGGGAAPRPSTKRRTS